MPCKSNKLGFHKALALLTRCTKMIQRCISIFIAQREFAVWCERICQYCRLSYNLIIKKMFSAKLNCSGWLGKRKKHTEYLTYGRHFSVIMWLKSQTHLWEVCCIFILEKKVSLQKRVLNFPSSRDEPLKSPFIWIYSLLTFTDWPESPSFLSVLSGRQSLHHHISLKLAQQAFTMHFLSAWNQNQEV